MTLELKNIDDDTELEMECARCGDSIDDSIASGAEYDGKYVDVCEECYYELTSKCTLCGERVCDSQVSEFILCKAEFSTTGQRPPGIYRRLGGSFVTIPLIGSDMFHGDAVLFVGKLPEFDAAYDLSGYICKDCAKPCEAEYKSAYGRTKLKPYDDKTWRKEKSHTRETILANPDMLRDLECDSGYPDGHCEPYFNDYNWTQLKSIYDLPDGLPTYHEWLLVEHRGVKVFHDYGRRYSGWDVGWLSVSPEPKYRQGGRHPQQFAACGLPTHRPYDSTDPSRQYYHGRADAIKAVVKAIEQGLIRQGGVFDADGNAAHYR